MFDPHHLSPTGKPAGAIQASASSIMLVIRRLILSCSDSETFTSKHLNSP